MPSSAELQHAHYLLSHLAPKQVDVVIRLLEVMLDQTAPAPTPLTGLPIEDEQISEEENLAAS